MADQNPLTFPTGPRGPGGARRLIGPIPPRDASGKLMLAPILGKRVKANVLGEPIRDKDGQPIEEAYDTRSPIEYATYEQGQTPADGATKGLHLFQVDYQPEALALVYARNETEAVKVYAKEMGITRFGVEGDPKATKVPT